MKSSLFVFAFLLIAFHVTPTFANPMFSALTCKDIESSPREDYFVPSKKKTLNKVYRERITRMAAAMFLNADTSKISMKKLNELAEDPATDVVEDPYGQVLAMAQIGFGGGNSINYYFPFGSYQPIPVASYDGDCMEQGTDAVFPFLDKPNLNGTAKLECKTNDPKAPVSEYSIAIDTEKGNYTGSAVQLEAKLNPAFENLTKLAKANDIRSSFGTSFAPTSVSLANSKFGTGSNVSFQFPGDDGERIIHLNITARDKSDASVWGRVFTNKVGGYHASDAYDFKYPATCSLAGAPVTGKRFTRTVKY